MSERINETIRFYLPADPYYYQVDNLPLEDLVSNDISLQAQIDELRAEDRGNTVGRAGFTELQPYVDAALPGTVSVKPGNFIGRTQRTSGGGLLGSQGLHRIQNGKWEQDSPPTGFGEGDNPEGSYNVSNPPIGLPPASHAGKFVGRTSVFNFKGASVSIDSFGFTEFENADRGYSTPPLGRIDLIGITTMEGAMDDPHLPGNPEPTGVIIGDGYPKLAVVKGAGITTQNNGVRQVVIGEKYITVGAPQELVNDFGRNLQGDVVPNPEFGAVPMPDDVVNANFARDLVSDGEIAQSLADYAQSNKNANFFLPIAYVYVPQSHVEGNPIPDAYLKDIRPFFRTAELALAERQAIATAISPDSFNPFVTVSHAKDLIEPDIADLNAQIVELSDKVRNLKGTQTVFMTSVALGQISTTRETFTLTDYGIPVEAVGVLLRAIQYGDVTGSHPKGYVGGKYGDMQVSTGGKANTPEGGMVNQFQIAPKTNGSFTARSTGVNTVDEKMWLFIDGYLLDTDFSEI